MADPAPQFGQFDHGPLAIARLNDALRANLSQPGRNRVVMTTGIAAMIGDVSQFRGFRRRAELMRVVRDFETFTSANDPYGERDMGSFTFEAVSCLWKINYYNADLSVGADDPGDPDRTIRVLTIMLVEER